MAERVGKVPELPKKKRKTPKKALKEKGIRREW